MVAMLKEEYADLSFFKGLPADQLEIMDKVFESCRFPKDAVIFDQGQVAINLYVLVRGEVEIHYKPYDGPVLTVARIRPGGVFGWSAALGRDRYTSGAQAAVESEALRLAGSEMHRFCEKNPEIGRILLDRLAGVIAERLSNTHSEILTILTKGMDVSDECLRRLDTHG